MTLTILLAMLAFILWACVHVARRSGWYQDEQDAAVWLTALRAAGQRASDASADLRRAIVALEDAILERRRHQILAARLAARIRERAARVIR